jgi:hypothetical protein
MANNAIPSQMPAAGGLETSAVASLPRPLSEFGRVIGRTPSTLWRWSKEGKIVVTNICGKNYITAEEIRRFTERAASGEFSKKAVVPIRRGATNGTEAVQ